MVPAKGGLSISAMASLRHSLTLETCAKSLLKLWKARLPPEVIFCLIAVVSAYTPGFSPANEVMLAVLKQMA